MFGYDTFDCWLCGVDIVKRPGVGGFNSVGGLRSAHIYFEFVGLLIWMFGFLVLWLSC